MSETISLSTVIGNIYEASYNPDFWPVALEGVAEFTHSNSAALLYQDNELEFAGGTYQFNISDDHVAKYNAYGTDPNFMIMAQNVPSGVAAAIDHIIPDRNELENIYGDEFSNLLVTLDIYHIGGAILFMDEVRTAGIALQRKQSMGGWTKAQIDNLNSLIPHLQRAMNIQKEFVRLQTREQALRKGLDRMLMGLILFDKELQPIYINPVAESILDYHPAIEMKKNKIYARDILDTTKMHKALVMATSSKSDANFTDASTALGLKHPDCETTLPLIISPIHDASHGFEMQGSFAHAVMCFSDPNKSHPIESDKLADIYGLTATEAQVAIAIANGMSTDEISGLHEVTISTVRSQLKSIYRKLGINHQTELVKILLTGPFGQAI